MDKKDFKILGLLLENSRESVTSIAKKSGVSREVAIYRINNLNKEVIKNYYANIDLNILGFKRYGCFMQFKGISQETEEKLLKELSEHPFINYFGPIIGKWNVVFDIHAKDEIHLKEILDGIIQKVRPYLDSYLINSPGSDYDYFPQKYVGEKPSVQSKINSNKINNKKITIEIDEIDKQILKILALNSRSDYVELGKETKLSANTIKYRIKNMEKSKIILGYTISLDHTKLGLQFFNIQLKLNEFDNKKFISYLTNHPNILYYYKYIGQENWDMDVGVLSKNAEEFRTVIIDIKKQFGEIIKIYDIYIIPHMIKDNTAPIGMFD